MINFWLPPYPFIQQDYPPTNWQGGVQQYNSQQQAAAAVAAVAAAAAAANNMSRGAPEGVVPPPAPAPSRGAAGVGVDPAQAALLAAAAGVRPDESKKEGVYRLPFDLVDFLDECFFGAGFKNKNFLTFLLNLYSSREFFKII